jgi:hypothetical protein
MRIIARTAFCLTLISAAAAHAAPAPSAQITELPGVVSGHALDVGVDFRALLTTPTHAAVDVDFGLKRIHAEVDYATQRLVIHSITRGTGVAAPIVLADLDRFQRLVREVPASLRTRGRHVEALGSLLNFIATAPLEQSLDIDTTDAAGRGATYTSTCDEINTEQTASFTVSGQTQTSTNTVGPMCYTAPAFGRCGMAGGPDAAIGLVQRFTEECFNHDACCAATQARIITLHGKQVNVCGFSGTDCLSQFKSAAPGFFFAPSCGTTEGNYTDAFNYYFYLTGGLDDGPAETFKGQVSTGSDDCPFWDVTGTRTGQGVTLTAKNGKGASRQCAGSFTYTGTYSDCGVASGTWTNDAGLTGSWSWERDSPVGDNLRRKAAPWTTRPTDRAVRMSAAK